QSFASGHCRRQCKVETARAGAHGNEQSRIGCRVHSVRYTRRFATEEKNIPLAKFAVRIGLGSARRHEEEPAALAAAVRVEAVPGNVTGEGGHFQIVHAGALEGAVGHVEPGGLDDVDTEAKA